MVIGQQDAAVNIRWANNTITTSGVMDRASLSVVSIIGRRVASITRTYFPPDRIEAMVRESEAACRDRPDAPDYMPLLGVHDAVDGDRSRDAQATPWDASPAPASIHTLETFVAQLEGLFSRARGSAVETFGFAEHTTSTVWLANSAGLRRCHGDHLGKVEMTAKTPDFSRSSWVGRVTADFSDTDLAMLFDVLRQRLLWSERRLSLPAGLYEVLLEPSCTADLAISAYDYMTRRDADEGRSPYSKPGGGTRIGDRLFGDVTIYSDPGEPGIRTAPFHVGTDSSSAVSVFDNGLPLSRTEWVHEGELRALVTPRYWAARTAAAAQVPFINNLVVAGDGPTLEEMIAATERALLITCFWYIRPVDPQTALDTGLTRDGVFLIEHGKVVAAVNNFRWNMSSIAALAQATEIGKSGMALPREHDEFLRAKAPPMRIARFNMSSPSEAM